MLSAKLFAGLAGLAFVIAALSRMHILPRANLWLTVGHVSFGAFYWQLFLALVCAVFSLAYFGIVRWMQHPLNQTTGLIGFFLVAVASVICLSSSFLATNDSLQSHGLVIALFASIFSFMLGEVLTAADLAWVLLRK